ncbi:GPI-anchored protein 52 [Spathaspora sp. JA1]|nr:GPI-anchored protein 52 [Spathaspora sp. JA1]
MLLSIILLSCMFHTITASTPQVNAIEFNNFGFAGSYTPVIELANIYDEQQCSCSISNTPTLFNGTNAPLNEEVSVHFRGPLQLINFASYVSDGYTFGEDNSGNFSRLSFYDAGEGIGENVTFLTRAGKNSSCLGFGLTFADSDGISAANEPTILADNTLLNSNQEFVIFSNVSCESSGVDNDCGVYREDIPAYHGFFGTTKMFLFKFTMPNETKSAWDVANYNMPAIWLLNAQIPRTAQYSNDVNCSCWRSGCGEFDIFEVMNVTEYTHLYSTLHDYQGTGDIESGLASNGHTERDLQGDMVGGVVFDSTGKVVVWMSNSTSFDEVVAAKDLNSWIHDVAQGKELAATTLPTVSAPTETSSHTTKKNNGYVLQQSPLIVLLSALLWFI